MGKPRNEPGQEKERTGATGEGLYRGSRAKKKRRKGKKKLWMASRADRREGKRA